MKLRKLRLIGCLAGTVLVVVLGTVAYRSWSAREDWPHFEEKAQNDGKPQSVIEFRNGRDYGYHTGNIVPLRISLKVPAGTEIDLASLALSAKDQEIARRTCFEQAGKDGVRYLRIDLDMQCMVYSPVWKIAARVNFRTAGDGKVQTHESEKLETSVAKVYDGKKSAHPKDPKLAPLQGKHLYCAAAWLGVGLGGIITCGVLLFRMRKPRVPKKPKEKPVDPWLAVDAAWKAVVAGNHSKEAFDELARQVRAYFKIGNKSPHDLNCMGTPQDAHLATILELCEEATWGVGPIAESRLEQAAQSFACMTPSRSAK